MSVERLTEHDKFGNADIIGVDNGDLQLNLEFDELNKATNALNRLAAYENTGMSSEEVKKLKKDYFDLQCQYEMYGGDEGITGMLEQIAALKSERDTLKKALNNAVKYFNCSRCGYVVCDKQPHENCADVFFRKAKEDLQK